MRRERALKVVLIVVGLIFSGLVYPLTMFVRQEPALAMMLSVSVTLGIFLLLAARNPICGFKGRTMKLFFTTILWTTFLLGCGGNRSASVPTSNAQLQGNWHLTLTSTVVVGTFIADIFILQTGTTLSSDRIALQPTCSSTGTMNGTVNGNKVNLAITGNSGDTVAISGSVSGSTFTGNYSTKTSGCGVNDDMGSVSATLIPSLQSASWTGTMASTQYAPGNTSFTTNLTEDNSANITGTLTFTGSSGSSSSCPSFVTGPFTGSQTGNIVFLSDNQADGLSLGGIADDAAKNITGRYFVSICSGDNGTVMLGRP